MATQSLQSILDEKIEYSSYSAEESFTLSDILDQKDQIDQHKLYQDERLVSGLMNSGFQEMFSDQEADNINTPNPQPSPSLTIVQDGPIQPQIQQHLDSPKAENIRDEDQQKPEGSLVEQLQEIDHTRRIQNIPLPPLSQIKNVSFLALNNVSAAFDQQSKGVGLATVITSNSLQYLAVGTSFGNVVLFEVGNKNKTVLGTAQNRRHGPISALAITRSGRYLVCAQENGLITIWDLSTKQEIKREMATDAKIVKVLFCSESQFVLADVEGNVFLFTLQNYFWVKLKKDRLFEKSPSIFYDLKVHSLQSGIDVVVLCSLQQVLVATYKPKVEAIDKLVRPQELGQSKLPNIQIGKTAILSIHSPSNRHFLYSDVLCVSWSNHILIYQFMEGTRLEKLRLVYRFLQETPIYHLEFISEGVLVALDNRQTFRSYRVWVDHGGGHALLNQRGVPEEVLYQRLVRDSSSKYIKLFNNTIVSCAFSPKQKQLFFICKNSIWRCRVYKWNECISQLMSDQTQGEKAFKLCIELYHRRLDIFLQPLHPQNHAPTTRLFCQVAIIYLRRRLLLIEKLKVDRATNMESKQDLRNVINELKQTYENTIEYMLSIKCSSQLFRDIYKGVLQERKKCHEEYQRVFLDCLQPFILQGRLTSLPSKVLFEELLEHYLPQNRRELIDNFIMFLDVETVSMFYEDAISICSENKLYKALSYVCSSHGDFLPPLTSLLNEVRLSQVQEMHQAQEIYYSMLKDYIVKLLGGCFINGTPLVDQQSLMKKSLSNWLLCRQTFAFFVYNHVPAYRIDYFYFVEELVYLLSAQPKLQDYIHCQLRFLTRNDYKEREVAELFLRISSSLTLEPQEVRSIINNSDSSLIQKHLTQYLRFYRKYSPDLQQNKEGLQTFYRQNKQLQYFHLLLQALSQSTRTSLLAEVNLLNADYELNGQLTKYMLSEMENQDVLWNVGDMLKIHSENTLVFMLQKFPLGIISSSLLDIKDPTDRYLVIRKILKKLRKQNAGRGRERIRKFRRKKERQLTMRDEQEAVSGSGLSLADSRVSQSEGESVESETLAYPPIRRLSKEVMQFYVESLCKFKNQKRVFYELVCHMGDYVQAVEGLIGIIQQYKFHSCLGLLREFNKRLEQAYQDYAIVYRHFFFLENYQKMIHFTHCHGRFLRRIFERMLNITSLLDEQRHWMNILETIIGPLEERSQKAQERGRSKGLVCDDIEEAYTKEPQKYAFIGQLNYIIEQCLINTSNKIPIEAISTFIGAHQHVFSRMFVLESFRATLLTYSNNARIYHTTNNLILNNQVATFQVLHNCLTKGVTPNLHCEQCGTLFTGQQLMNVYKCGHSFHDKCPALPGDGQLRVYTSSFTQSAEGRQPSSYLQIDDKCSKCSSQFTEGQNKASEVVLPDFHRDYQQSMLIKGMVGFVTIIPNLISALPQSLDALASLMQPIQEKIIAAEVDEQNITEYDDNVLGFLAFSANLQELEEGRDSFVLESQKYFDEE